MTLVGPQVEADPAPAARLSPAAANENFPVASFCLAEPQRRRVIAFYRYARAADDIADDGNLSRSARLSGLLALERGLLLGGGIDHGSNLRRILGNGAERDALAQALALLRAFRSDVENVPCAYWSDLMRYCEDSAVPVGRFLLSIHGERSETREPSDALCAALQVLNHLQDMGQDWRDLGRCYLPGDWMKAEGATDADLAAGALSPGLRRTMDRTLDATDGLLTRAESLPGLIRARGLRLQAASTLQLARRLAVRLRRTDPLARRVILTRFDFIRAAIGGLRAAR